ncbi:hypothetical protein [Neptuniibacter pectenicola]|uniref:hypothetical protein n=1 Tax=Neptuniibacter pectenicola TaxID=1806669 RepID=UPI000AD5964D|nr:hypothetical protein [Neptuniibacter pectenicola]
MNRYTFRIYSNRKLKGTIDLITDANKQGAAQAAQRHALTLYPLATVQSVKAA